MSQRVRVLGSAAAAALVSVAIAAGGDGAGAMLPETGTTISARAPAVAAGRDRAARVGHWSRLRRMGVLGIHANLLPTGKVLLFGYPETSRHSSDGRLWDPKTGRFEALRVPGRDLFCSGHSLLPDGRLLVTGGQHRNGREAGIRDTHLFDPASKRWSRGPRMRAARWYPTNTALPDGRVLITSGNDRRERISRRVEIYDPDAERVSTLPRATRTIALYPQMFVVPGGRVIMAGQEPGTLALDVTAQRWTHVATQRRGHWNGNAVLLPGGRRILVAGGSSGRRAGRAAELLDTSASRPRWRRAAPLRRARAHSNAVLLPDGTVLVVGGNRRGEYGRPVRTTELFDPASESWRTMAAISTSRGYHSTALLLPDGRVISTGQDGRYTYQVYSPPYLFRGSRPVIGSVPMSVRYGSEMRVVSPDAGSVRHIVLMRPGSVTHAIDMEQRHVELGFRRDGSALVATAPPGGDRAPPGHYMLFLISSRGVPSEAAFVRLG